MSLAFSADWLALREPADHTARDAGLALSLGRHLAARDGAVDIVDLGCGTGSNLRALAPMLSPVQNWRLVDHDAALLGRAGDTLAAWAEEAEQSETGLRLRRGDLRLTVTLVRQDIAVDLESALGVSPHVVTAAALFDLVSRPAIERLVQAVARRRAAFLTTLTYDGSESWHPPHPADGPMQAAFLRHLTRDKGLGPALGHEATQALAESFRAIGYEILTAPSPWDLGAEHDLLRQALARGKAEAVAETGLVPAADVASWLKRRMEGGTASIGHTDLLALPRQ